MNKVQADILWLAYEDDSGLWDVAWNDDHEHAEVAVPERVATIAELARNALIEVLVGAESVDFTGARMVPRDELETVLNDPRAWRAPALGECAVRLRTTETGFAEYRAAVGWTDPA